MHKWLIIAPILLLLIALYMIIQAAVYKTRYNNLEYGMGLRILHLTDIHINLLNISSARMRKTILSVNPDFILIGGDIIDRPKDLDKFAKWFKEIDIKLPVFAVFGNHEHTAFKKYPHLKKQFINTMKELDIRLLTNEVIFLQGKQDNDSDRSNKIALIGIDDIKTGAAVSYNIFNGLKNKCNCIVAFSHNPDISLHIPESSVDLLLLGHFHGGQIWMPFKLEYLLFRRDRLCQMGHISGFSTIRKNLIYINRGLGTVIVPFRFLSIPEVTVIDI
jgi:predicted MPP superfamily phosphohydrolase